MEEQPKILLPKPYPDYIKSKSIHRKLDLFSKSSRIREWFSAVSLTSIYYLYLFNKYKSNCLITSNRVATIKLVDLALVIIGEMSEEEKNNYMKDLENTARQLANCIKRNIETIVIPLTLIFTNGSHANILIYRRNGNVIEHFEPHGQMFESGSDTVEYNNLIHKNLNDFRDMLNKLLEKDGKQPVKIIKANDVCPMIKGLQTIESTSNMEKLKIEGDGYCAAWSMFFTELALKNPTIPSNQLLSIVYDKLENMTTSDASNYLRQVIRGYVSLIYEKIEKYFSLILDEKITIDKIIRILRGDKSGYSNFISLINHMIEIEMEFLNNPSLTKEEYIIMLKNKWIKGEIDAFEQIKKTKLLNRLDYFKNVSPPSESLSTPSEKITRKIPKEKTKKNKPCPEGKERNPKTGRCIKINTVEKEKTKKLKPCPEGKERNPKTGRCNKIKSISLANTKTKKIKPCPQGKERNPKTGRCIKINTVEKEKTKKNKPKAIHISSEKEYEPPTPEYPPSEKDYEPPTPEYPPSGL